MVAILSGVGFVNAVLFDQRSGNILQASGLHTDSFFYL